MKALLTGFILLIHCQISAQTAISGTVIDAESGRPLSHVNIFIENSYTGTITNSQGAFQLRCRDLPAVFVFSHIGYRVHKITLTRDTQLPLSISLAPTVLTLDGITVTANDEDPGMGIMRKALKRLEEQRRVLKSYQARAYTRMTVGRDSTLLSMGESLSTLYWHHLMGLREVFEAKKQCRQLPYLTDRSVGAQGIVNLTDEDIVLLNHRFAGPFHSQAFHYYNFKLEDVESLDDRAVFKIAIVPKSSLQPLFKGYVYILDQSYAVVRIAIENTGAFSFATMLKDFKGCYEQNYSSFGGDFWLPIDSRSEEYFTVDMGMLRFPRARTDRVARLSDYEINAPVQNKITYVDTSHALPGLEHRLLANAAAFDQFDAIPLNQAERQLYSTPDTTLTLMKAYPPRGSLSGYMKSKENEMETAFRSHSDYNPAVPGTHMRAEFWYNRVEGAHVGIGQSRPLGRLGRANIMAGYESARKKAFFNAGIITPLGKGINLDLKVYEGILPNVNSSHYSQTMASLAPLLGRSDYFDYHRGQGAALNLCWEADGKPLCLSLGADSRRIAGVAAQTDWALLKKQNGFRPNPLAEAGRLNTISATFLYDEGLGRLAIERMAGGARYNTIRLMLNTAPAFINSRDNFLQLSALVDFSFNTLYRRRPDPQYLRIRLAGACHSGTLPLTAWTGIDASLLGYAPFGTFKTARNRPLLGEDKAVLFWEYNLMTIPFEWLGLAFMANQKFELSLHGAHGRTWTKDQGNRTAINDAPAGWHHEAGLSLTLKYYFMGLRLDGVRDLQTGKHYLGFGLRMIGMHF